MPFKPVSQDNEPNVLKHQASQQNTQNIEPSSYGTCDAGIIRKAQLSPRSLTPQALLQLQSVIGNRGVGQFLQNKGYAYSGDVAQQKASERAFGIPQPLQTGLEALSGVDLSRVRVHHNSSKPAQFKALAYTHGQNIFVGPSQAKHLPHEGWHAVQQMQGRVQPTFQEKGLSLNNDAHLEHEADVMGARATRMGAVTATQGSGASTAEPINIAQPSGGNSPLQLKTMHDFESREGVHEEKVSPANRLNGEIAIMSGGPTSNKKDPEHDKNPLNFLTTARVRIEDYIQNAFANRRLMSPWDHLTWAIMRPSYIYRAREDSKDSNAYLKPVESRVPKLQAFWNRLREGDPEKDSIPNAEDSIAHHYIDDKNGFTDFMNNGIYPGNRDRYPIKQFEYFGHGYPGRLTFLHNWEHVTGNRATGTIVFTIKDIKRLSTDAFLKDARYRSWSCNTATPRDAQEGRYGRAGTKSSFAEEWIRHLGGRFVAPHGRTTYETLGEVDISSSYYGGKAAHWVTVEAQDYGVVDEPEAQVCEMPAALAEELISATPGDHTEALHELAPLVSEPLEATSSTAAEPDTITTSRVPTRPATSGGAPDLEVPVPQVESGSPAPTATSPQNITDVNVTTPETHIVPDTRDAAWRGILNELGRRAYEETGETDDIPGTLYSLYDEVGNAVWSHTKGFRVRVAKINGVQCYQVTGRSGAIGPGWYPIADLKNPTDSGVRQLAAKVNAHTALKAGALSKSVALLTVVGNTLDYAIDPEKEFGTDYAVDVGFDLVKASGSSAVGAAAGAGVTSMLAGGALGATVGSAAPVIGTVVGFVVGILAAMAIEYFISDYRAGLKSWLRGRKARPGSSIRWGSAPRK